jgi:hypothetical protein
VGLVLGPEAATDVVPVVVVPAVADMVRLLAIEGFRVFVHLCSVLPLVRKMRAENGD